MSNPRSERVRVGSRPARLRVNGRGLRRLARSDLQATSTTRTSWTPEVGFQRADDRLACEEPFEIRVQGQCLAVVMRTPGHDAELAAGFLLTEGLVRAPRDIVELAHCQQGPASDRQNIMNVFLAADVTVDFARLTRHVFASSSCGICGKASIEAVHQQFPPISTQASFTPETVLALPEKLRAGQRTFEETGGLHAAGVFTFAGEPVVLREDVGRHNAVDKVIGWGLLQGQLPWSESILVVSGRASFEILQKALAAGIPCVAAVSAPSSLAVEFAQESGQTLIGFLRGHSMNIYSGEQRMAAAALPTRVLP